MALGWITGALVALLARPAHAARYEDGAGFSLDYTTPGAITCVAQPPALTEAAACEGLDLAAARGSLPPQSTFAAYVRYEDADYTVMLLALPRAGTAPMTLADMRDFARGWESSVRAVRGPETRLVPDESGATAAPLLVNGLQVVRIAAAFPPDPATGEAHALSYLIVGRETLYSLLFLAPPAANERMQAGAAAMLQGVQAPAPAGPARWEGGGAGGLLPRSFDDPWFAGGFVFGALLVPAAGILLVALVLWRQRRARAGA